MLSRRQRNRVHLEIDDPWVCDHGNKNKLRSASKEAPAGYFNQHRATQKVSRTYTSEGDGSVPSAKTY